MSSIKFWVYIIFLKIATNFARGLKSFKIRVDHKLGGKGLDRLCKKLTEFNINKREQVISHLNLVRKKNILHQIKPKANKLVNLKTS